MARSKVKSRSHHDVAHLRPLTNVPTKYQLPTVFEIYPRQDFKGLWGKKLTANIKLFEVKKIVYVTFFLI